MDQKTLAALVESIERWFDNLEKAKKLEYFEIDSAKCKLCEMFIRLNCAECPVGQAEGEWMCGGTPWYAAKYFVDLFVDLARGGLGHPGSHLHKAFIGSITDEVIFLLSLLPEGHPLVCGH